MKQYLVLVAAGDRDDSPNYQVAVLAADHIGLDSVRRAAFKQLYPDRPYDETLVGLPEDLSKGQRLLRGIVHVGFEEFYAAASRSSAKLRGLLEKMRAGANSALVAAELAFENADDVVLRMLVCNDKKEMTVEEPATPAAGG